MDDEQTSLLSQTLREVLAGPPKNVDALLQELGWDEVVADDPATATRLLFTEHGRALARTNLLDRIVLDALADDLGEPADVMCYPSLTSAATPSIVGDPVQGLLLTDPGPQDRVAIVVSGTEGIGVTVIDASALSIRPTRSFDPSLSWRLAVAAPVAVVRPAPSWPAALAAGRRALATEIISVSQEVLRLAVEHTSTRYQFGAPIAAFQAVRHRLAEGHVAIAAAQALLDVAFADGSALTAAVAKAQAGRAHEQVSAHALQVSGAMGSSLEHPLHRFVSRGTVLDALLGGWSEQIREFGELVQRTGDTPRLVEV
jgi:hypothetical protein